MRWFAGILCLLVGIVYLLPYPLSLCSDIPVGMMIGMTLKFPPWGAFLCFWTPILTALFGIVPNHVIAVVIGMFGIALVIAGCGFITGRWAPWKRPSVRLYTGVALIVLAIILLICDLTFRHFVESHGTPFMPALRVGVWYIRVCTDIWFYSGSAELHVPSSIVEFGFMLLAFVIGVLLVAQCLRARRERVTIWDVRAGAARGGNRVV
jgi:hypothetical protein